VALTLLRAANLTGSQTVLIEAAAGGVGGYLTQLAHARGAGRVIATAGTQPKRDYALSAGADEVVDHGDPGWIEGLGKDRIDVVFESLAGQTTVRLVERSPRWARSSWCRERGGCMFTGGGVAPGADAFCGAGG
jgi:NADPH:quinone reductase-like Zn-dependent oxidoreductase